MALQSCCQIWGNLAKRTERNRLFVLVYGRDHLVYTRDQDFAGGIDELAHEQNQVGHRLMHATPEYARVKVPAGAGHGHFEI
jgi:hypothetical protein